MVKVTRRSVAKASEALVNRDYNAGTTITAGQQLLLLPFAVATVMLVCAIPYLLVERPFMVWRPGKNRLADAFRRIV